MDRCLSLWQAPFPIYCATVGICTTLFGFGTSTTDTSLAVVSASVAHFVLISIFFLVKLYFLAISLVNLTDST